MKSINIVNIIFLIFFVFFAESCSSFKKEPAQTIISNTHDFLRKQILDQANQYFTEEPITVTNEIAARSAGGIHNFYSEGHY